MPRAYPSLLVDEAAKGSLNGVLRCLKSGHDINATHEVLGNTALHAAAEFGHLKVVQALLQHGADINALSVNELDTALHRAAGAGRYEIVAILLKAGADKDLLTAKGETALDVAISFSKDKVIQLLGETPSIPVCSDISWTKTSFSMTCECSGHEYLHPFEFEVYYKVFQQTTNANQMNSEDNVTSEWTRINQECDSYLVQIEIDDFDPATTFLVRVRAQNQLGFSDFSRAVSITTESSTPTTPSTLECVRSSPHTLKIKWEASIPNGFPVQHYQARYKAIDDSGEEMSDWITLQMEISREFVTIDELKPSQLYACSIRALNSLGWSEWTDYRESNSLFRTEEMIEETTSAVVELKTVPKPVTRIYSTSSDSTSITVQWDVPRDTCLPADSFALQVSLVIPGQKVDWHQVADNITTTHYKLEQLEPNRAYRFAVKSRNDIGWGEYITRSYPVFYTKPQPSPPILSFLAHKSTADSIELSWEPCKCKSSSITYELRIYSEANSDVGDPRFTSNQNLASEDFESTLATVATGIKASSFNVTNLMPATTYFFSIRARNSTGWGPFSRIQDTPSMKTEGCVPFPPLGLDVVDVSPFNVTLEWIEPRSNGAPIDNYEIHMVLRDHFAENQAAHADEKAETCHPAIMGYPEVVAHAFESTSDVLNNFDPSQTSPVCLGYVTEKHLWRNASGLIPGECVSYTVEGLRPAFIYCFAIRARNKFGWGDMSSMSSLAIGATKSYMPDVPVAVGRRSATKSSITVRWDAPRENGRPIQQYQIALCPDTQIVETSADSLEYTFSNLQPGTGYMVTVRARNEIGWGAHAEKVIYTESDVPSAPKRVQASEDSQQSISVQWMKPHCHGSEIIRYGLQCRENGKDWVMICGNITGTTYTFTKTNDCLLLSGVLHAVRVRAMNSVGWGPFSNGSAAECQLILDPSAPCSPSPPCIVDKCPTSITISWNPPDHTGGADITMYEVQTKQVGDEHDWQTLSCEIQDTIMKLDLMAFKLLGFVYAAKINRYERYEATEFSKNLSADVDAIIKGYFEDLTTILSNLNRLQSIAVPFSRRSSLHAIFQYKPEEPVYHLQPNHYLPLYPQPKFYGRVTFFFQRKSGSCSRLSLYRRFRFSKAKKLVTATSKLSLTLSGDTAKLYMDRWYLDREFGWENVVYLYVPNGCVLLLTSVKRTMLISRLKVSWNDLEHSHRNNRPVEMKGLVSYKIHNFNRFHYLSNLNFFPLFTLQSFADGLAEFGSHVSQNAKIPYVIPQNISIEFTRNDQQQFLQDTVVMVVRKSDLEACRDFEASDEITVEATSELNSVLSTPVNCELYLIRIHRTVQLIPHRQNERALQYGGYSGPTNYVVLRMNLNRIHLFVKNYDYIESLDHLPLLQRVRYEFGSTVYRKLLSHQVLPKNVALHLYTAAGPVVFRKDIVRFSFDNRPFCKINLFMIPVESETREPMEKNKGLALKRFTTGPEQMKIIYDRTALSENFPVGTKFIVESSCLLHFTKMSRKISGYHNNAQIRIDSLQS